MKATNFHWTYSEWLENTVRKLVRIAKETPEEYRDDHLTLQITLALGQALRHGRSGQGDDDPVTM